MSKQKKAKRRRVMLGCALAFTLGMLVQPLLQRAHGAEVASLRDQLEKGLQVRFEREFEFVDLVLAKIENEELPLVLVRASFKWAREKHDEYPFPYFERALRTLARRKKIDL